MVIKTMPDHLLEPAFASSYVTLIKVGSCYLFQAAVVNFKQLQTAKGLMLPRS